MTTQPPIPAGYRQDATGRLVHESLIKPIDTERDALVARLAAEAKQMSAQLAAYKARTFADIAAFVELSAEQYGVALGGTKGNVTLVSFDGRYKVIRQVQETLAFDERLQAAKALVDECIMEWATGANPQIITLVNDAFQVNREGQINTARVLSLQRLDISDPKWQRAMQAIRESIRVASSKSYVRVYERVGTTDRYEAIPLDVAGV